MPIYEFYCPDCHTIYNFRSKTVETEKRPACPDCKGDKLQRRISSFAVVTGKKGSEEDPLGDLPIDESKMESALASLASDVESIDENDPRALATLMRKLSRATGLEYGEKMEEALGRLEAGEDPDAVEAEMGDLMEGDELPFKVAKKFARGKAALPPKKDDALYDM